jgi:glycosyltransferase involved in cell wall biosynthesis
MNSKALVSIGIPTYNRPLGLQKTINAILQQDYTEFEIIISDNCSPGDEIEKLLISLKEKDSRITFYIQPENKGALFNFYFVLEKARGDYFMWAADDDEWQGKDFLSSLMKFAPANILTFPDATIVIKGNRVTNYLRSYENCKAQMDYVQNFCHNDCGYPFYGVYNLGLFQKYGMKFEFDSDMTYHGDGLFLHKLFLAGPTKYVKEATIMFNAYGSVPSSIEESLDNWTKYIQRSLLIYANASLSVEIKYKILKSIINKGSSNYRFLLEKLGALNDIEKNLLIKMPPKRKNIFYKVIKKIKRGYNFILSNLN